VARKTHTSEPLHAIEEFESAAERLAHWIRDHAVLSIGLVVLALAVAGGYGGYGSWQTRRQQEAADALDRVRDEYLAAMGAPPGATEVPELANPKAAERIQAEYLGRFREIAEPHAGTVAGTLAWLQVGDVLEAQGRREEVLEVWQGALAGVRGNPKLRGILHRRIGFAHEEAGDWAAAAAAYEAAGNIKGFPLRYWALADAARCFAQAGQSETALALLERVETEAPDLRLPSHLRALLRELRVAASS
jgi:tetratricopeptide (TPR) repeat protein